MSFQRITTSASVFPAKSEPIASRSSASPVFSSVWTSTRWMLAAAGVVHALDRAREGPAGVADDDGLRDRGLRHVTDAVHDHLARGLVDVVADVVEASRERVQIVPVVGDDEGVVEQADQLVRQVVAHRLELADLLRRREAGGKAREELDEQLRDVDEVVRCAREQLGEVVIPRNEAHASAEPTRFPGARAVHRYP